MTNVVKRHANQHGFRSRVSCETQLIQFTQDLYNTLNDKGQTDVIVMDFSKAFDKVDNQRLLLKLHRLGINNGEQVINWIQSFLSNRTQSVVLDGEHSDSCPVLSGVPQGSVLGPCLFLMYINDMPDTIKSNIRLFADGTIMYLTISGWSPRCYILSFVEIGPPVLEKIFKGFYHIWAWRPSWSCDQDIANKF